MIVTQLLNNLTGKTTRDRLIALEAQIKTQNDRTDILTEAMSKTVDDLGMDIATHWEAFKQSEADRLAGEEHQEAINQRLRKDNDRLQNRYSSLLDTNEAQALINADLKRYFNTSSDTLEELVLEIEQQKVKDAESIANLASHIQQLYAYQDGSAERLLDLELVAHMGTGSIKQRDSLRRIGERLTYIKGEIAKQQESEALANQATLQAAGTEQT